MAEPGRAARVLVVEHEQDAGLDLMALALRSRPVELTVLRPHLGDRLPEPPDEAWADAGAGGARAGEAGGAGAGGAGAGGQGYDALVVLGGSMGALDDEAAPWLPATRRLLAGAVRTGLPTLGICLGAQLLARACGGTVERGAAGLEIGLVPVTALPNAAGDPFFGPIGSALAGPDGPGWPAGPGWPVVQYHFDAVTRLPADGEPLLTGRVYPYQGFRVGAAAWGVQYHPEVSVEAFTRWVIGGEQAGELHDPQLSLLPAVREGAAMQERVAQAHASALMNLLR